MARASFMTRDQALESLRECQSCKRWVTTPECDHCWVDNHKCPPTVATAKATLQQAMEVGQEAQRLMMKLRDLKV